MLLLVINTRATIANCHSSTQVLWKTGYQQLSLPQPRPRPLPYDPPDHDPLGDHDRPHQDPTLETEVTILDRDLTIQTLIDRSAAAAVTTN